jgi:hypothetical protein
MSKANTHPSSHKRRAATIAARAQERLSSLSDDARALRYVGAGIAAGDYVRGGGIAAGEEVLVGLMIEGIAERFKKKINRTYGDVDHLDFIISMPKGMSAKMAAAVERRRAAWEAINNTGDIEEGDPRSVEFNAANEAMRDVPIRSGRDAAAALSVALEEIQTFRGAPETVDERLIKNAIKFLGGGSPARPPRT